MTNFIIVSQVILWLYVLMFLVLIMHELIHLLFVKLFKKELISFKINVFGGKVTYVNDTKHAEILLISLAPSVILPILGAIILYADLGIYYNVFALFCLINMINFLPVTADGRVALYCLLKMMESKTKKV
ncbi:MAG TPA: DUF3267 domain-containing protein [Virgibacillus sp.]|nr:DUF3267 domain-containing protein [Virgibacillus sp.]